MDTSYKTTVKFHSNFGTEEIISQGCTVKIASFVNDKYFCSFQSDVYIQSNLCNVRLFWVMLHFLLFNKTGVSNPWQQEEALMLYYLNKFQIWWKKSVGMCSQDFLKSLVFVWVLKVLKLSWMCSSTKSSRNRNEGCVSTRNLQYDLNHRFETSIPSPRTRIRNVFWEG